MVHESCFRMILCTISLLPDPKFKKKLLEVSFIKILFHHEAQNEERKCFNDFDIWTNVKFRFKSLMNIYESLFAEISFTL